MRDEARRETTGGGRRPPSVRVPKDKYTASSIECPCSSPIYGRSGGFEIFCAQSDAESAKMSGRAPSERRSEVSDGRRWPSSQLSRNE